MTDNVQELIDLWKGLINARKRAGVTDSMAVKLSEETVRAFESLATENAELNKHFRNMLGLAARAGVCEPIEGFVKRPQDAVRCMKEMSDKIIEQDTDNARLRERVQVLSNANKSLASDNGDKT